MTRYNFEKRNIGFLCMKPSIDNRKSVDKIYSRIGIEKECFSIYPNYNIYSIINEMVSENKSSENKLQWILVDESQFLTPIQVEQLRQIVDDFDINVMCYGLRTDFQTHLFEGSKRLFELATKIESLPKKCECGNEAIVNARYDDNGIVYDGDQVVLGSNDSYKALCYTCYKRGRLHVK